MIAVLILCLVLLALVAWNAAAWPAVGEGAPPAAPLDLSVLIPARDEAAHIEACLDAVFQAGGPVREALVYDDHSHDDTAERVRAMGTRNQRIRLVPPEPLPPDWCGKTFACAQLAASAQGEWLLFLDADARLAAGALDRMAREAHRREATFLSCWPGLDLVGFWERALMPMLNFVVFTIFPAALSLRDNRPSLGLGHGACILVRADTYRTCGGHAAVRSEVFEDTMLARHWRRSGGRGLCLDGQHVVRVRMYDGPGALWAGFQKNFYPAFRTEAGFWGFWLFHAGLFVWPALAAALCLARGQDGAGIGLAAGAVGAAIAMRLIQAAQFRYPAWSALLHPLAEVALLVLGLDSWFRCRFGRGVTWKGRRYRAPTARR